MIFLDTNVFSALMQTTPDARVIAWLDEQPASSIWTTSITLFEIRFGVEMLPASKKRTQLSRAADDLFANVIEGRIASFDETAAREASQLEAKRRNQGRPRDFRDSMIAAIVTSARGSLATRNVRHFDDLLGRLIDPWNHP